MIKTARSLSSSISVYVLAPMIMLTLISGLLIVMLLLQERTTQDRMIEEKHNELVNHGRSLHEEYRDELVSVASLISNHPLVKNGLLIGNQYEVLNSISVLLGHSGIKLINVYDVDGVAFARAQAPSRFGDKDVYSDLALHVVQHHGHDNAESYTGVFEHADSHYLVSAKLISSLSGPAGSVVVAIPLDEDYLARLLPEWHAGLGLYSDGMRIIGSREADAVSDHGSRLIYAEENVYGDKVYEIRLAVTEEVFPELRKFPLGIMLIVGLTAILSVALTFLILFRKVIRPAKQLILTAEKQVSGNLSERVQIDSNDELGRLGNILNVLTGNLQNSLREKESVISKLNEGYRKAEKSRAQLDEIIQSIPNPIAITDLASGQILLANRSFAEYFEVDMEDCDAVDIMEFCELPSQHLYTETSTSAGSLVKIKGANQAYALHYCKEIGLDERTVMFNAFVDISSRVRYEDKLTRLAEDLERRVDDRTRDLLMAKHKAEMANDSKSRFLAAASHDLRQPVNAMSLFITNLLENPDTPRLAQDLHNIASCINALRGMFDQILDISRLEAGVVEPSIKSFPLNSLFQQIRQEYGEMAMEKGLDFRCPGTSVHVISDPVLLHRIIANLISNAIKNTRKGKVLLGCKRDGHNQRVKIIVMDTGPGIRDSDLENIFKEYYRVDRRSDRRAELGSSMGLGLSIVEHTAKLLEHDLDVSSVVGKHSKFCVSVPVSMDININEDAQENHIAVSSFHGMSVLVVEDDMPSLEALSSTLQNWGCNVNRANTFMQACDILARRDFMPEVIITDYLLDERTGIDLIKMAENLHGGAFSSIILSGVLDRQLETEIKAKGYMLMYKPICPAVLRAHLASLLNFIN